MSTPKPRTGMLSLAHALHAGSSFLGILALPFVIIKTMPEAPIAKPFSFVAGILGSYTVLAWALGSLAIWLLVLSRIYDFAIIWRFFRHGVRDKTVTLSARECIRVD